MNNIDTRANALQQAVAAHNKDPQNLQGCLDALQAVNPNQAHPAPTTEQFKDALSQARALAKKPLPPYKKGEALDIQLRRAILPLINIHGAKAEQLAKELKAQNDKVTVIQDAIAKFARSVGDDGKANITSNQLVQDALKAVKNLGLNDANLDAAIKGDNNYDKREAELLRQALETVRDHLKRDIDDKKTSMETYQKNYYEMWQIFSRMMQEYNDIVLKAAQKIHNSR